MEYKAKVQTIGKSTKFISIPAAFAKQDGVEKGDVVCVKIWKE